MSRTDLASLLIHADREAVFAALVDPDALLAWLPPKGMRGRFERFDLRDGGSYRLVLTYDDAAGAPGKSDATSDVAEVRIARVVPGELIEQLVDFESDDPAFGGRMRMAWSLRSTPEGTLVEFAARDVPDGVRARDHAEGLTSSLVNLAAHFEPGAAAHVPEPDPGDEPQSYPAEYAAAHGSFALIPAAYVFLVDGDRVLLQQREGTGYYDGWWAASAAGHVDPGESVLAGAVRETLEELGVEVDEGDLEPVTAMHRTAPTGRPVDQRLDVFFVTRAWRGIPALQEPDKASALEWFALDALPERLVHHERYALEGWRDGGLPAVTAFGF
ncbi:NUDIX domain-containing protein [Agromyces indicus]|uniref:NUDIX domain-containing protein n=1 Tax=Agromyces indicus TaxID=758919 RepID=A0ABU1FMF8_9MICO|nr:NUDIX domain-containing protein [Agromyces indicus]MDR5692954.1 NUDIX domain-containing protein [Agromyces indicus]